VGQLDDALIGAILRTLQPAKRGLPVAPEIERRKAEIRSAYWRKYGQAPPVYQS
jgi:hypothetical protein